MSTLDDDPTYLTGRVQVALEEVQRELDAPGDIVRGHSASDRLAQAVARAVIVLGQYLLATRR